MHKVKASDLISLRKALADDQPAALEEARRRMPADLRATLDKTVASTWLDEPEICKVYRHFAEVLFPGARAPFVDLGRQMALASYRGVYRVFLAIPSTGYVIKKAASVWASYHSTGSATMEDVTDRSATLVVRGAEPISRPMIDVITGHIVALAELTGAKDPIVAPRSEEPRTLKWAIRWK
jgi:hypothetical protein